MDKAETHCVGLKRMIVQKELYLTDSIHEWEGAFNSTDGSDFSRLGAAIGHNLHLKHLRSSVNLHDDVALDITNTAFYDGLRQTLPSKD